MGSLPNPVAVVAIALKVVSPVQTGPWAEVTAMEAVLPAVSPKELPSVAMAVGTVCMIWGEKQTEQKPCARLIQMS